MDCACHARQKCSARYLRYLCKCGEILASRLANYHNLAHYAQFMASIRQEIAEDNYGAFRRETLARYAGETDLE